MSKYCPVYAALAPRVAMRETFEIIDDASGLVVSGEVTLQDECPPVRARRVADRNQLQIH
jgi:hypothetical protein